MNRDTTWITLVILTCAAMLLVLSAVIRSHAQCAFDAPAKAKSIKTSLVRAYASCPGATFASPNTTTMAGVPGCAPPASASLYSFDDKGSCSVSFAHSVGTPCPDGIAPSCSVVKIVTKCRGLLDPGGAALASGPGWTLNLLSRTTMDDDPNGDMTVVDVPVALQLPDVAKGKVKATFDVGQCVGLCPIFGPSNALPVCAQIELVGLTIRDPDGNPFAKLGSSSR